MTAATTAESTTAEKSPESSKERPPETWRDTFEQIVLAFILALVFRTFEAEAFVIPTGSMAPTLYGRNKETTCSQCGHEMVVGASSEVTRDSGYLMEGTRIEGAICPNCFHPETGMKAARVFNGDRILVNKFPYEIGDPDRWDVFVFKYPEKPGTNYIKRLVGLPGETIRIRGGDVFRVAESGSEEMLRKPPEKQRALQILVNDHDYAPSGLDQAGWPQRWIGMAARDEGGVRRWSESENGWTHDLAERVVSIDALSAIEPAWLRYRHVYPLPADWEAIRNGQPGTPVPRLITDFCGYNAVWGSSLDDDNAPSRPDGVNLGAYWVSDLTANAELTIDEVASGGELLLELCEGTWWYRCRIDLSSGKATLSEVAVHMSLSDEQELATAATSLSGSGRWDISFANVDDRICLWIDGDLVDFGEAATRDRTSTAPRRIPQPSDLAPVGVAVRGAKAHVAHLRLERDIYYRGGGGGFRWEGGRLTDLLA
ncbi:MAG: signal peptidase I [Planctomycetaceae bacterium]